MQVRHITISQKSYIEGIKKEEVNFSNKEFDSKIETNKDVAIKRLKELDKELKKIIESTDLNKSISFHDGVAGVSEVKIEDILHYLIANEFYHQGIFTCYGRLAGLGKFLFM